MAEVREELSTDPRIAYAEWSIDYNNGILRGLVTHQGRLHWLSFQDSDKETPYHIFHLDDEAIEIFQTERERFHQEIGYHFEHDPKLFRPLSPEVQTAQIWQYQINPAKLRGDLVSKLKRNQIKRIKRLH